MTSDALRILISTDNHLGFEEHDAIRGDDSFLSFAEVLSVARAENVDLLLLGGDLFHDNKPSRECLYRCMKLLREHCCDEREPHNDLQVSSDSIRLVHDAGIGDCPESILRASLPVFAVHGNHDDPVVGARMSLSPLDILQAAGLVNYWGTVPDSDEIRIRPLLLRKGDTKLALYGLGHVREERLYATWQVEQRVVFEVPADADDDSSLSEYFHLFVLHQNRERRGHAKAVTRDLLPEWIDLVVWGHEHPCRIELEGTQPAITQPGSTVATALTAGEAIPKHIGLLEIRGTSWRWTPIPLQTVRPFHYEDMHLTRATHEAYRDATALERYLRDHIEQVLVKLGLEFDARQKQLGAERLPDRLRLPLIRLRVEYDEGFNPLSPVRFGRHFLGRVANASNIVVFHRRARMSVPNTRTPSIHVANENTEKAFQDDGTEKTAAGTDAIVDPWASISVLDLAQYLLCQSQMRLGIVPDWKIADAVDQFVNKGETRAVNDQVETWIARLLDSLQRRDRNAPITDHAELLQEAQRFAQQHAFRQGFQQTDTTTEETVRADNGYQKETSVVDSNRWQHRTASYLSPTKLRLLESIMHDQIETVGAPDASESKSIPSESEDESFSGVRANDMGHVAARDAEMGSRSSSDNLSVDGPQSRRMYAETRRARKPRTSRGENRNHPCRRSTEKATEYVRRGRSKNAK
ncbi:hypothetical protein CCYA_CCYA19G4724 [Cyanidiococcus yangmingshanensis]|nr:hypothetical protein CCYA_CCYA19G4724 [Cyanidiococcus yangmingshanensis]